MLHKKKPLEAVLTSWIATTDGIFSL